MSKRANPKIIGGFVIGAIVLIIAGVIVFSSGQLFIKKPKVIMYFKGSVKGLNVGAPVDFKGVQVGKVTEI